jgi:hypothetical protein
MDLDVAYVHGFSYMNPVVPSPVREKDWSVWQADYLIEQQKFSFLYSLFTELERGGVKLINSPKVHLKNFAKPTFLQGLKRSGFLTPKLLCTNDMESVMKFCSQNDRTVWRPTSGRAAWQLFLEKQRQYLIKKNSPPILLAEAADGPLLRGYIFDGEALLILKNSVPDPNPPEKLEQFSHMECDEINDELRGLASKTAITWALVHFVLKEGRPCIFDIDVDPILNWLPEFYRKYLTEKLAHRLAGIKYKTILAGEENLPNERPTIFLRRMLQILFEFERSKYGSREKQ